MAVERPKDRVSEPYPHRPAVYDGAPAETVPPKHWTDLPRADRESHLEARPRLRHLIWAAVCLGGVLSLVLLTIFFSDTANGRTLAKTLIAVVVLLVFAAFELFRAWRVR